MSVGDKRVVVTSILVVGSVIGLIEATLGASLHLAQVPHTGAIMTTILFFISALGVSVFRPGNMFVFMFFAGSFSLLLKFSNYFIPGVFPGCDLGPFGLCLFPSMVAIVVDATSFGFVGHLLGKHFYQSVWGRIVVGFASPYLAFGVFGVFFFKGVEAFLYRMLLFSGSYSALMSVFLVPLGFYIGDRLHLRVERFAAVEPWRFCGLASLVVFSCFLVVVLVGLWGLPVV